jgi:radical SAM protein with 4Fe4S-binding SPASM domain
VIKILVSFGLSRILRKPIVWGMPLTYSVEPTNFCNLKCPECPSGTGEFTRPLGFLTVENFRKIIDEINDTGFYMQLFFQGEPYLNKKLNEMVEFAQRKKIYVSVSTNGNLISAKNIDVLVENVPDKIIFSLDGLDEESYQNYRVGGTFKQADEALRLLVEAKRKLKLKKPFVELQFIVMKQNEHLLEEVRAYSKKRFVDRLVFKTMQISSHENALKYLPTKSEYSRYVLKNGSYEIKGTLKDHCFALWRTAVITWDNKMVPCCFDKDADYVLGNLNQFSIRDIWKSELYQNFRRGVLNNRKGNSMCNNCTEGLKVNIFQMEN